MFYSEIVGLSTVAIYAVDTVLLVGLVSLKVVHRRRAQRHKQRRQHYVGVLSSYLSDNVSEPITPEVAKDPAFLDALIDIRGVVTGPALDSIEAIVANHGVTEELKRRLESRLPLGRRLRAAVALAEIGDSSAVDTMIRHLSDTEPEIRIECARGLARLKWTPAIDHIVER
ncbi:MAG TPA: HEAT repeat domain-containing protein, partial [Acidimicrobiia bacterium]|nr:HEAT repeat domain-containing protein [Acidimicrobiia bacterium]